MAQARRRRSRSRFRLRASSAGLLALGPGEEERLFSPAQPPLLAYARIMDLPLMLGRAAQCGKCGKAWWSSKHQGGEPWKWMAASKRRSSNRRRRSAGKGQAQGGGKGKEEKGESPPPSYHHAAIWSSVRSLSAASSVQPPAEMAELMQSLRKAYMDTLMPEGAKEILDRAGQLEGRNLTKDLGIGGSQEGAARDATGGEQPEEIMVGAPRAHLEAVGDAEAGLQQEPSGDAGDSQEGQNRSASSTENIDYAECANSGNRRWQVSSTRTWSWWPTWMWTRALPRSARARTSRRPPLACRRTGPPSVGTACGSESHL